VPTAHSPREIRATRYSTHGLEVQPGARTLYITGQIALDPDGNVPSGITAQTELVYGKIRAILRSAGMDYENLVKTTVFLVHPEDHPEFVETRSHILGAIRPASSLAFVKGLPGAGLLLEVEAIAVDERA